MNYLFSTVKQLNQVSVAAAREYSEKSVHLVELMNTTMQNRPDIEDLTGKNNLAMMRDNHANHARFIGSILINYNQEVLIDTILWVFRAYRSKGFSVNYWSAQLNAWITILKTELSETSFKEIYPYYEWIQVSIPQFVKLTDDEHNTEPWHETE